MDCRVSTRGIEMLRDRYAVRSSEFPKGVPRMTVRKAAQRRRTAALRIAALLGVVAGVVAATGSVMIWMRVPGGIVFTRAVSVEAAKGIDTPFGIASAAAAALLIVAAVSWLTWARTRRGPAVLVLLAGATILGCTIYSLATIDARFVDFAVASVSSAALPATGVKQVVATILSGATTDVHVGMGLILTTGAGGLASLVGLAGLVLTRSTDPSKGSDLQGLDDRIFQDKVKRSL
jgi:hypothetical protein